VLGGMQEIGIPGKTERCCGTCLFRLFTG